MTVNHDVTGSSPVWGATKSLVLYKALFLCFDIWLERISDISLTSHSSLCELTVNLPLGEEFAVARGFVLSYVTSPRQAIYRKRYARCLILYLVSLLSSPVWGAKKKQIAFAVCFRLLL